MNPLEVFLGLLTKRYEYWLARESQAVGDPTIRGILSGLYEAKGIFNDAFDSYTKEDVPKLMEYWRAKQLREYREHVRDEQRRCFPHKWASPDVPICLKCMLRKESTNPVTKTAQVTIIFVGK